MAVNIVLYTKQNKNKKKHSISVAYPHMETRCDKIETTNKQTSKQASRQAGKNYNTN
jgi:hypothetical protein